MQKRLAISLTISLLGILLLFSLCLILQPQKTTISQITKERLNEQIKLETKIIKVIDFPASSFQILTLQDSTGKITATSSADKQLKLTINKSYLIYGKITEYNHTLQIAIDKIELVS